MSDSFGARARKFMGWYSPEEPIDEFEDFQEYDEVEEEARRLVDFAAGLTFGLRGVIERVTARVFLLSPASVEVTGDNSSSARRGSLYNQG